uniref:Protein DETOXIFICATION n=2 Tax=Aegilops tauschii subsp. strangulata TaxID=200361 RepID=A0A452ZDK8_AEGTS
TQCYSSPPQSRVGAAAARTKLGSPSHARALLPAACFREESLLLLHQPAAGAMDLLGVFFHGATLAFERDDLGKEIMGIAVPGALALMADPLASLVDTAFIGRIGPVEIAAVGVSIVVFNQVTRIAVFPLVSVTTSFVAEEDATSSDRNKDEISGENEHNVSEMDELITHEENNATSGKSSFEIDSSEINTEHKRKKIPSVSTALLLGGVLGLVETLLLVSCAKPILDFMGVKAVNFLTEMHFSIGHWNVESCITVLSTQIFRCSCCSFISGNARGISWT